jgi:hypothetical protein
LDEIHKQAGWGFDLNNSTEVVIGGFQKKWLFRSLAVLTISFFVYIGASAWVGFHQWVATLSAIPAGELAGVLALRGFCCELSVGTTTRGS